ncbi:MAG: tRNA adenosine(34) deaminase TadA [Thermodesulfobacteriota bacterium]
MFKTIFSSKKIKNRIKAITRAEEFMTLALKEAEKALQEDEVPIGAVLVSSGGKVIAADHNRTRQNNDPTAHAEILVLRKAARVLNNFRLPGTMLYVTIEPCLMCAGAVIQARVDQVVFGTADPKGGALGSIYDVSKDGRLNHRFEVISGVLETDCRELIQKFFEVRRNNLS